MKTKTVNPDPEGPDIHLAGVRRIWISLTYFHNSKEEGEADLAATWVAWVGEVRLDLEEWEVLGWEVDILTELEDRGGGIRMVDLDYKVYSHWPSCFRFAPGGLAIPSVHIGLLYAVPMSCLRLMYSWLSWVS